MGRLIAIDYGLKRVGIAVTDPLKLIATPLITLKTVDTLVFLQNYTQQEVIEAFVVGLPKKLNNTSSCMTVTVRRFIKTLAKSFPSQPIFQQDERYTSKIALAGMIESGFKKKDRRNKAQLDQRSAALILQSFLTSYHKGYLIEAALVKNKCHKKKNLPNL